ncbi:hypothetical protein [Spirillospora sp. NBC_01491]|uniref:hypothetical protein n=1 Tax=Spirillospora sp. NBC_01491 TaxID=2976007 RepID=UPI002E37ADBF|nr:hypothetical protein [Spirillospora sp. NBC_01491]
MLDVMTTRMVNLVYQVAYLASRAAPGIPNPGQGEAPPFANSFLILLKWGVWGALFCGVGGFVIIGARMTIKHQKGEGGNHVQSMVIVGFGCITAVSGYFFVSAVIGSG